MKIAVIGSNGQLGSDICAVLERHGHSVVGMTHDDVEIAEPDSVRIAIEGSGADSVVNTAAMHHVESCEKDPLRSYAVNAVGARNLALAAANKYLVHVSTDYVFDGSKGRPYVENDRALPLNVYGNSKLAGECFVLSEAPQAAVVRVSGIYGHNPCRAKGGMNFVRLMLKLARERDEVRVVDDEVLTPTFTEDIAQQVLLMLESRPAGLYHATAQGACSWYEFAKHIFDRAGLAGKLQKARPGEFPAKVRRPSFSVLENENLRRLGLDRMPAWQDGLDRYLALVR